MAAPVHQVCEYEEVKKGCCTDAGLRPFSLFQKRSTEALVIRPHLFRRCSLRKKSAGELLEKHHLEIGAFIERWMVEKVEGNELS